MQARPEDELELAGLPYSPGPTPPASPLSVPSRLLARAESEPKAILGS